MKLWIFWLTLACAKQNGVAVDGAKVPTSDRSAGQAENLADAVAPDGASRCFEECTRANMARAVAWEMIEADCMKACGLETLPEATLDITLPSSEEETP